MKIEDAYGKPTIYDEDGNTISQSAYGNRFMFTGREYDPETGNYYYRARDYNPKIGCFLQTDPIRYYGGLNLYTYCGNNPLNWVDPLGLRYRDHVFFEEDYDYWEWWTHPSNWRDWFFTAMGYGGPWQLGEGASMAAAFTGALDFANSVNQRNAAINGFMQGQSYEGKKPLPTYDPNKNNPNPKPPKPPKPNGGCPQRGPIGDFPSNAPLGGGAYA